MPHDPTSNGWPSIAATTLADRVYQAVRVRILEGHIVPGEFIREKELNEALGVSRTPIREALSRLASEGFLEKIPHRGFRVPQESLHDLLELYPIVAALDLLAGRLALPHLTPEDIAHLRTINDQLSAAQGDAQARVDLNNQFHHVFGERSGNQRLCSLLDDLRTQLARLERWFYSYGERTEHSVSQHAEIISAIEERDHARALSLLETNMSLTYSSLLAEMQREHRQA